MKKITSKDNPIIKEFIRLYNQKSYRVEKQKFGLEGVRLICDAYDNGIAVETLLATQKGLERLNRNIDAEYFEISEEIAKKISDTVSPQGVFAICKGKLAFEEAPNIKETGAIALCSLQDPGNVGTILRTASAFNIPVIMTSDCPSLESPKVLRAGMGLRRAYVVEDMKSFIKNCGVKVYASCLESDSKSIEQTDIHNGLVLIGNEGNGLDKELIASADEKIIIPMQNNTESLNVSSATSIILWQLR